MREREELTKLDKGLMLGDCDKRCNLISDKFMDVENELIEKANSELPFRPFRSVRIRGFQSMKNRDL